MSDYGTFPKKIEVFRGCDKLITLQLINPVTKLPINYVGSTFSAYLIDQQEKDHVVVATLSLTTISCLTACFATLQFKIDQSQSVSLYCDQAYLRIYREVGSDKFPWAIGEVEIKD